MEFIDIAIFIAYALIIFLIGSFISRSQKGKKGSNDYFFAGNTLPWYLVGTSIIAANISAEQFIGMSGSGYAIGLGIATYEWIAAIILLVVAKFFLPILIKNKIFTMPQFMEHRYDKRIKTVLAFFWISLFIFVNLTSILYLGAITLAAVFKIEIGYAVFGLALFTLLYSIMNGLKAIASTDIIQVFFLIAGGIVTTYLSLNAVSDNQGFIEGFKVIMEKAPEKLHMVIERDNPNFKFLPGVRAIFGGIWIAGIYYFGANQYIIQKALGSKNLKEAQRGMLFAGYLKLFLPVIVVLPGIAAFVLHADIAKPDEAYPWLLSNFIPSGVKGFIFAALIAAIVSSLSAIVNSTSTIFTMDIYKPLLNKNSSDENLVRIGRISGVLAMMLAACIAPFLGKIDQAFQFIQEFTGMISPGICAIFILGLFWKKTTSKAALNGLILSVLISIVLKLWLPEMPFLDKMLLSFLVTSIIIVFMSLYQGKYKDDPKGIVLEANLYKTDSLFNSYSIVLILILISLYVAFW